MLITKTLEAGIFNSACALSDEIASRTHLHFLTEVDASGMDRFRAAARLAGDVPPTYTAFVVKAVALALRIHPRLNALLCEAPWGRRRVTLKTMTATVAVERIVQGADLVIAPTVQTPDALSLEEITLQLRRFASAPPESLPVFAQMLSMFRLARWFPRLAGILLRLPKLTPSLWKKFRGGSFVVTSPGKYGGFDRVLPPWPWPMTFSFGLIAERPMAVSGRIVARRTMPLTITADRRLAHGAEFARFAKDVGILLSDPERMIPKENNKLDSSVQVDSVRLSRPQATSMA